MSDKFAFGLFDLDWDVFTQHIEGAINRIPVLEKTGVKSTVCGPGKWGGLEAGMGVLGSSGLTAEAGWAGEGPRPPLQAPISSSQQRWAVRIVFTSLCRQKTWALGRNLPIGALPDFSAPLCEPLLASQPGLFIPTQLVPGTWHFICEMG